MNIEIYDGKVLLEFDQSYFMTFEKNIDNQKINIENYKSMVETFPKIIGIKTLLEQAFQDEKKESLK
jgi:hypothetical protein